MLSPILSSVLQDRDGMVGDWTSMGAVVGLPKPEMREAFENFDPPRWVYVKHCLSFLWTPEFPLPSGNVVLEFGWNEPVRILWGHMVPPVADVDVCCIG